ncbi:MAG: hypothetical protein H8D56_03090 [Planctomycetes bacterium]|nr:hypothetical protein [Planctomycetota bacterium]MBL7146091.1 hypothetical protein [Phycisphaerae bacterium]
MFSSSKKQIRLHRTASAVMLAVYLLVTTSVDLFHNEACTFGAVHPTDVISHNDSCPACTFLAGHNSAAANYGSTLVGTERLLISQSLPRLIVLNYDEWSCSFIPRAPPSITIS